MTTQDEKKREASAKIAEILVEIDTKYKEAAKIADDASVDFYYPGPTYGAGVNYFPKEWVESSEWYDEDDIGWQASSNQDC